MHEKSMNTCKGRPGKWTLQKVLTKDGGCSNERDYVRLKIVKYTFPFLLWSGLLWEYILEYLKERKYGIAFRQLFGISIVVVFSLSLSLSLTLSLSHHRPPQRAHFWIRNQRNWILFPGRNFKSTDLYILQSQLGALPTFRRQWGPHLLYSSNSVCSSPYVTPRPNPSS